MPNQCQYGADIDCQNSSKLNARAGIDVFVLGKIMKIIYFWNVKACTSFIQSSNKTRFRKVCARTGKSSKAHQQPYQNPSRNLWQSNEKPYSKTLCNIIRKAINTEPIRKPRSIKIHAKIDHKIYLKIDVPDPSGDANKRPSRGYRGCGRGASYLYIILLYTSLIYPLISFYISGTYFWSIYSMNSSKTCSKIDLILIS